LLLLGKAGLLGLPLQLRLSLGLGLALCLCLTLSLGDTGLLSHALLG
jgi:hypothetical protein